MLYPVIGRGLSVAGVSKARRWVVLAAVAAAPLGVPVARAADLNVDATSGNSPLTSTATATYDTIRVAVSSIGTLTQNSGTLTANTALIVAANANSIGTYTLANSGVLNVLGAATVGLSGNGTFNQNAGTATFTGGLTLSGAGTGRGTYNLNGGTLTTSLVRGDINGGTNAAFYFNGGTLRPTGGSSTFFQGLSGTYIRNGGATIDTNGLNVNVGQNLLHSNINGDAAKDGGITKIGNGTLTLTGSSTYTGDTKVFGGTLSVLGNIGYSYRPGFTPQTFFRINGTTAPVVNLSGNGSITSYISVIGDNDKGILNQSGGTHSVDTVLSVGRSDLFDNSASDGAYTLSGGTLNAPNLNVGDGGKGTFTHTAGTANISALRVGYAPNNQNIGTGTYTLSGTGQLTTGVTLVAAGGAATFTQTGGTHNTSNVDVGEGGATGSYSLSGTGLFTVARDAIIGNGGTGSFNHSAGTFKPGQLTIGSGGANSTYTLSGNGQLQIVGAPAVGTTLPALGGDLVVKSGKFTQTGGTSTMAGRIDLGTSVSNAAVADYGTFALAGGTATSNQTVVGNGGRGTFTHTAGTHVTNQLIVALGGLGAYTLGGIGTLNVNGDALIGSTGVGSFTQTASQNQITGTLYLGFPGAGSSATTGQGTFTLSDGSVTTGATQVANYGTGTFNQSGGLHATSQMLIGLNSGNGIYNLSGSGVLNLSGALGVGYTGPGTFNQTGGTVTTTGATLLSVSPGGTGTYNLNGGTITTTGVFGNSNGGTNAVFNFNGGTLKAAAANGNFLQTLSVANIRNNGLRFDTNGFATTINQPLLHSTINGDAATDGGVTKLGTGTLTLTAVNTYTGNTTVTGGTLAITAGSIGVLNSTATFSVDGPSGSNATASLSGTGFIADNVVYVGRTGTGTFNQSAGTHQINTTLNIGVVVSTSGMPVPASIGTYNLSGGTVQSAETQLGDRGTGTFNQTGGTHKPSQLSIGLNATSGFYTLSGTGQLTVSGASVVGLRGIGNFTQTGGTHSARNLFVGRTGAIGNYNLSGGQLRATNTAFVGSGGMGKLTQTDGTATVAEILYLGYAGTTAATGDGTYNLFGGTLTTAETQVGNTGTGTFAQTAGTLTTPRLFLGLTGGTGVYNLSGTGQLNTTNFVGIGLGGPGTFNQTGGTANFAGGLIVSAGTNGVGTYNLDGGTIAAQYVSGTKNGGANATFNFNGGTLRPTAADPDYFEGFTAANVRNGGVRIDTNGINTGINQVLRHSAISGDAAVDGGLTKLGAGTLTLSGANTYTGTTTISAGTLALAPAAYSTVLSNAGGANVAGGKLVLSYAGSASPAAQVKSILTLGYANNFAAGQIRSTTLAAGQTLGYGDNGSAVTLLATLPGDADLNGTVDFNDFLILQNNFNAADTRFDQGNFNYDAATNFNDFLVLQNNFGKNINGTPTTVTADQVAALRAFAAAVPEPTSLALLGLGGALLLRRRR